MARPNNQIKSPSKVAWTLWALCAVPGYLVTCLLVYISQAGWGVSMLLVISIAAAAVILCTTLSLYLMRRAHVALGILTITLVVPTVFAIGIAAEELESMLKGSTFQTHFGDPAVRPISSEQHV